MSDTEKQQQQNVFLDLATPREISFRVGKFVYSYLFKRITDEAWLKFFAAMHITSERDQGGVKNTIDVATAASDLVRSNVTGVDGYAQSFKLEGEWQKALPPGHVKLVAGWLQDATIYEGGDDSPVDPMSIEISLASSWTASGPGKMQKITGLKHRFAPPSGADEQKYNRALSETRVVGNRNTGTTIYPSRQAVLVQLYDELIQSVDGYVSNGSKLEGRAIIAQEMDAFHKVVAVRQLFAEPEID